jgi:hypothetical protein
MDRKEYFTKAMNPRTTHNRPSPWVVIRNISDYSPFGVLLAERTVEGAFYQIGFHGQEKN